MPVKLARKCQIDQSYDVVLTKARRKATRKSKDIFWSWWLPFPKKKKWISWAVTDFTSISAKKKWSWLYKSFYRDWALCSVYASNRISIHLAALFMRGIANVFRKNFDKAETTNVLKICVTFVCSVSCIKCGPSCAGLKQSNLYWRIL